MSRKNSALRALRATSIKPVQAPERGTFWAEAPENAMAIALVEGPNGPQVRVVLPFDGGWSHTVHVPANADGMTQLLGMLSRRQQFGQSTIGGAGRETQWQIDQQIVARKFDQKGREYWALDELM